MGLFTKKPSKHTLVVTVPEMSCAHCEKTIDSLLSPLPGVKSVKIDVPAKEVRITGTVSLDAVQQALADSPYSAELKESSP